MQQSILSQTPREKEQEMYVERKMKSVWDRKTEQKMIRRRHELGINFSDLFGDRMDVLNDSSVTEGHFIVHVNNLFS